MPGSRSVRRSANKNRTGVRNIPKGNQPKAFYTKLKRKKKR